VLWIQRLLNREGYYSGPLDSTFGEATSAALAKFIRARARVNYDYTQLGPKAMEIFKGITVEVR
jgi:peptidoglycan hydrolase-like protein with peptidoglycan-binding domain